MLALLLWWMLTPGASAEEEEAGAGALVLVLVEEGMIPMEVRELGTMPGLSFARPLSLSLSASARFSPRSLSLESCLRTSGGGSLPRSRSLWMWMGASLSLPLSCP